MSFLTAIVAGCLTCIFAFGLIKFIAEFKKQMRTSVSDFMKTLPIGEKTIITIRRPNILSSKIFQVTYEYSSSKMEEPKKYTTLIKARSGVEAERIFKETETYKTLKKEFDSIPPDSLRNVISQKSDKVSYIGVRLVGEMKDEINP